MVVTLPGYKHEDAALACWDPQEPSGSYLVLGAHFSGLGDFAPGGRGGLFRPRYGHGWLRYPLEYEPVAAVEGGGGAGSSELASRSDNLQLFTGLWSLITCSS